MRRLGLGTSALVGALVAGATSAISSIRLGWRGARGGRGRVTQAGPAVPPAAPGASPALTVLVPAFREAGVIVDKVDDLRANGYPGPLEVVVIADGDPQTAEAAKRAGARGVDQQRPTWQVPGPQLGLRGDRYPSRGPQ